MAVDGTGHASAPPVLRCSWNGVRAEEPRSTPLRRVCSQRAPELSALGHRLNRYLLDPAAALGPTEGCCRHPPSYRSRGSESTPLRVDPPAGRRKRPSELRRPCRPLAWPRREASGTGHRAVAAGTGSSALAGATGPLFAVLEPSSVCLQCLVFVTPNRDFAGDRWPPNEPAVGLGLASSTRSSSSTRLAYIVTGWTVRYAPC